MQGILVDRSVHAAIGRFLPSHEAVERRHPSLIADDFVQARQDFLPVSMRDITKSPSEGGRVGWEDIGGLNDVRNAVKEVGKLCLSLFFYIDYAMRYFFHEVFQEVSI